MAIQKEILDALKSIETKQDGTHSEVITIKTVLLGVPHSTDTGLVGKVNDLEKKHNKLANRVWLIIVSLAGSGALGAGVWKLLNGG